MYNFYFRQSTSQSMIVSFVQGDVNGDRISDNVYLTGTKTEDSQFVKNITLIIQDGRTARFIKIPLKENMGYNPQLFLGNFTGDGVNDILISINSGGSGAIMYYYIYSFVNNNPQLLFDFEKFNAEYEYEVTYINNYKVEVVSEENNTKCIIDISLKGEDYLSEIYNEDGILKSPINGFVNPISGLYPVDFDRDGVYELLIYQRIAGRYNADALGYILSTLKWQENMFVLNNQNLAIYGAED